MLLTLRGTDAGAYGSAFMQGQRAEVEQDLASALDEVARLRSQLKVLLSQGEEEKRLILDGHVRDVTELQSKVQELEQRLEQRESQAARDAEGVGAREAELEQQLAALQSSHHAEMGELLRKFEEAQRLSNYVSGEMASLTDQLGAALADKAQLQARVTAMTTGAGVPESKAKEQEWANERAALQRQLSEARLASAQASAEMEELHERLEARLPELERTITGSSAALQAAELEELRRQVQVMREEKADLERELQVYEAARGSDEVGKAVALAVGVREGELARLRAELEAREAEVDDMHQELLEVKETCLRLEFALRESESKRASMSKEKQMMELHLQETTGELVEVERQLEASRSTSLASSPRPSESGGGGGRDGGYTTAKSVASDAMSTATSSPTPPLQPQAVTSGTLGRTGNPFAGAEAELAQLREENQIIMTELVSKKLELAELYEANVVMRRDLLKSKEKTMAVAAKMTKLETLVYSRK